jgi:hypothetical protein
MDSFTPSLLAPGKLRLHVRPALAQRKCRQHVQPQTRKPVLVPRAGWHHTDPNAFKNAPSHLGSWMQKMAHDLYERICKALDFVDKPMALEVLDRLVHERPYSQLADSATISAAVDCLCSFGAVRLAPNGERVGAPVVELTTRGRALFWRLVEIQQLARQQAAQEAS